jgi:putative salt-induced outer membrane protein YdiY
MKKLLSLRSNILLVAAAALSMQISTRADGPIPEAQKTPHWESSASAGVTLTRGNSDTLLAALAATTQKKWDGNELSFGADATYGSSKINGVDSTTANSLHGFGQYNRLFTERLYGYFRLDGLHDDISRIRYRLTASPGLGYYFIKTKSADLSGEVGPGFVAQKLGDITHNYFTARLAEKAHLALSDRARLWQSVEFLPEVDHFKNYIINFEIGVEADLTADKKFTLRAYLQDTYNNEPAIGRKKSDTKLVTALAYKF